MMMFAVPGRPFPLRRHRTGKGIEYDPPENKAAKEHVAVCARAEGVRRISKPQAIYLTCIFVYQRPKKPKYDHPIGRPDIDNLVKLVLDALNRVAWDDDSQVTHIDAAKQYGDKPQTIVAIVPTRG
jgi:Holliday junction resolvase RusA-like endonuclease